MINISHNGAICQTMEPFNDIDDPIEILLRESTASIECPLGGYNDLQSKYSNLCETYKKKVESSTKVKKCLDKCLKFYSKLCKKNEAQKEIILKLEESLKEKLHALEESLRTQEKMKGLIEMYSRERALYSGVSNEDLRHEKKILLDICCKLISESVKTNNTRNLTNVILTKFKKDLDEEKLNLLKGKDVGVKKEINKIKRSNSLLSENLKYPVLDVDEKKINDIRCEIEEKHSINDGSNKTNSNVFQKLKDVGLNSNPSKQTLIHNSAEEETKSFLESARENVRFDNVTTKEYSEVSMKDEEETAQKLDFKCNLHSVPSSLPFLDEESGSENESNFKLNSFNSFLDEKSKGIYSGSTPIKNPELTNQYKISSGLINHVENDNFSAVQNKSDNCGVKSKDSKSNVIPSEFEGVENKTIFSQITTAKNLGLDDPNSNNDKHKLSNYNVQKEGTIRNCKRRKNDLEDRLLETSNPETNNIEEDTRSETQVPVNTNVEFQKPKAQSIFDVSDEETSDCEMDNNGKQVLLNSSPECQKRKIQSIFDIPNMEANDCEMGSLKCPKAKELPSLDLKIESLSGLSMTPKMDNFSSENAAKNNKIGGYATNNVKCNSNKRRNETEKTYSHDSNAQKEALHSFHLISSPNYQEKGESLSSTSEEQTNLNHFSCKNTLQKKCITSSDGSSLFDSSVTSKGNSDCLNADSKNTFENNDIKMEKCKKNVDINDFVLENDNAKSCAEKTIGSNAAKCASIICCPDLTNKNNVIFKSFVNNMNSSNFIDKRNQREKRLCECSDSDDLFDISTSPKITTDCSDTKKINEDFKIHSKTINNCEKIGNVTAENLEQKNSRLTNVEEKTTVETYICSTKNQSFKSQNIVDISENVMIDSCKNVNFEHHKINHYKISSKLDSLFGAPSSPDSDDNYSDNAYKMSSALDTHKFVSIVNTAVKKNDRKEDIEKFKTLNTEEKVNSSTRLLVPSVSNPQVHNSNTNMIDIPFEVAKTSSFKYESKKHKELQLVCYNSNGDSLNPPLNTKLGSEQLRENEFNNAESTLKDSEITNGNISINKKVPPSCPEEDSEPELTQEELHLIFRRTSLVRLISPIRELNHQNKTSNLSKSSIPFREEDKNKVQLQSRCQVISEAKKEFRKRKDSQSSSRSCEMSYKKKRLKTKESVKMEEGGLLDSIISAMSIQNEQFKGAVGCIKMANEEEVEGSHSSAKIAESEMHTDSFTNRTSKSEPGEVKEVQGTHCRESSVPHQQSAFDSLPKTVKSQNTQNAKGKCVRMDKIVMEKLKSFVSKVFSEEDMETSVKPFISILNNKPEEVVATCMVAIVFENADEQLEVFERPIPSLTRTQHRLFVLLSVLKTQGTNYEKLSLTILTIIFEKLFPDTFFWFDECVESACRFYAAICKMRNDLKSFWKLCLRAVAEMKQRCSLVVFTALKTWPDALHQASTLKNNILAMTVVNVFLHMPKEDGLRNGNQKKKLMYLKSLLMDFYGFKINDTIENYTGKVIESFVKDEQGSRKCLVLLAECRTWSWTNKHILTRLKELMNDWSGEKKTEDSMGNRILAVIKDISVVCKGGSDKERVKDIVSCLSHFLSSGQLSHKLEEKVIEILLEVKRHPKAREVIREWIPKGVISEDLRNEIINASAENILREMKPPNYEKKSFKKKDKKISKKSKEKKKGRNKKKQQTLKKVSSPTKL